MNTDNIADLITRIRNAHLRGIESIDVPYTKMSESILATLKENGFIVDYKVFKLEASKLKNINVSLKYLEKDSAISFIQRVSKPSLRVYIKSSEIQKVLGGLGMYVISTPRGVVSSFEAKKKKLGGEVLIKVY